MIVIDPLEIETMDGEVFLHANDINDERSITFEAEGPAYLLDSDDERAGVSVTLAAQQMDDLCEYWQKLKEKSK